MNYRPYTIEGSTDIGGVSPWLAMEIWQPYASYLDGIEVIGWRWSTAKFLSTHHRFPLTRIHGPLGDIPAYDRIILPDNTLLNQAKLHQLDVLIHTPHAANGFARSLSLYSTPKSLWIENHLPGEQGIRAALQASRKYHQPVNLMIDLAHYINPLVSEGYRDRWMSMIETISRLSQQHSIGLHFPIGDKKDDSIDLLGTSVTDEMLSNLKQAIQSVKTVVLEYQSPLYKYAVTPSLRKKIVYHRLDPIMSRLIRVGII